MNTDEHHSETSPTLTDIYNTLLNAFGPQQWWPADTPAEVIIGAILTQNTAWTNVERAIDRLKKENLLSLTAIHNTPEETLADLIRSAGTFRVKARRLKVFAAYVHERYEGGLNAMFSVPLPKLRDELLEISGIGPETADAILLYAGNLPTFVVDAYTRRILRRHHLIDSEADYHTVQNLFRENLHTDAAIFNEYHALLVELAKRHCRTRAICDGCPLKSLQHDAGL